MRSWIFLGKRSRCKGVRSALKFRQFSCPIFPVLCVGQRSFSFGDGFPSRELTNLGINGGHVPLIGGKIFLCIDRVDRTLGYAHRAVNAAIGIDGQKIGPFNEAIYGTNVNAVCVFATDAAL
jgi:hypothetical protein